MTGEPTVATTLHGYFRSSASYRVRIALNLKNISYDNLYYHLRKGEHKSQSYLAINPHGLVPSLNIDNLTLSQSLSIIEYLEETHPQPALLPGHPADRARVRAIAQAIACDIHPLNNLRVLTYLRTELAQPEASVQAWYAQWIGEGFSGLEAMLRNSEKTGRFCHGNDVSIADICLVPQVANARNFKVDLALYPTLLRIVEEASALPAFLAARPDQQADAE